MVPCIIYPPTDWYATFCALAGIDSSNRVAMSGAVHDIDGVDVWFVYPCEFCFSLTHTSFADGAFQHFCSIDLSGGSCPVYACPCVVGVSWGSLHGDAPVILSAGVCVIACTCRPMITGSNATQPRGITPTSEAGIIEVQGTTWWKLITLAGDY